ncbi:MAG: low molecular weight protein arginine phosphatase [Candidatus Eremiobacteraeota bacterium]|nr:low molecular weight protein arginine phosphatase [Candidatus Eremiobacteraeota bacterium]
MRILFVCTGNTCRSPLAAAYLREKRPGWSVESAGVAAEPGAPASDKAQELAAEVGLELGSHKAQPVGALSLEDFDRIYTMSSSHLRFLPKEHNAVVLSNLAGKAKDVDDPYGRGLQSYREAFDEIRCYLDELLTEARA